MKDLLDPWLGPGDKGFPAAAATMRASQVGAQRWNVLRGDLPLPLAVIREDLMAANLAALQRFATDRGVVLAPHGKTTMAPGIFRRQLDAGAWGMTVASVAQLAVAAASGARNVVIANQVFDPRDLDGIARLRRDVPGLRVMFLLDSEAQLAAIQAHRPAEPCDVLLEMGYRGGRTGCRDQAGAVALARRAHASPAVRLAGVECYEGLVASGDEAADRRAVQALLAAAQSVARACDEEDLFDTAEVILSAGGSAFFDLVAPALRAGLRRPVRGVLRSGCYVTHDHGMYARMQPPMSRRLGCDVGLAAALEVWARVQSVPEPGLAILTAGKRDVSYDVEMPLPVRWLPQGGAPDAAPRGWKVARMNDQHAYLALAPDAPRPAVGDRVALGISHPCTTFDKWRWLALVDGAYDVRGALVTCF